MRDVAEELESALGRAEKLRAIPESAAMVKPDPQRWSRRKSLKHHLEQILAG